MARKTLATRIQTDPACAAVIKLVGYLGIPIPISQEADQELSGKFTRERVRETIEELLDFDPEARIARLKPGVRRLCRSILGPAPEEWDAFYEGVQNPPPNLYKKEADAIADAVAEAIRGETGHKCEVTAPDDKPESRVITVLPTPPALPSRALRWTDPKRFFSGQTDKELVELLDTNHHEMTQCKPGSESFQLILHENGLIAAEQRCRAIGEPAAGRHRGTQRR
jgi:hypothetical protein